MENHKLDCNGEFRSPWRSYVPQRHAKAKSVVFFRVQDRGPEYDHDLSMGWDTYVTGDVQVHIVPGGHLDMLSMPAVRVVAEKLAAYLLASAKFSGLQGSRFGVSAVFSE